MQVAFFPKRNVKSNLMKQFCGNSFEFRGQASKRLNLSLCLALAPPHAAACLLDCLGQHSNNPHTAVWLEIDLVLSGRYL